MVLNKVKKVPLRSCVVTKEVLPKKSLVRVAKEGIVSIDLNGKAPGRGAYLKLSKDVILLAKRQKHSIENLKLQFLNKSMRNY